MDYQAELRSAGITISMSGKGNCYDNAMVEAFFKTLKSELVWPTVFPNREDATAAIARYIDGFYNPIRRHAALGYSSPAQFERAAN
jgi:transposase InsO family protein